MANYLIVGASSGIGLQLASQLAAQGATVYGTYYRHAMTEPSPLIHYRYLDVLDETPDLGDLPEQLDGMVYCPGSIQLRPFERIKVEDVLRDYALQVGGAIKIIQAVLPRLKRADKASIVLFSTVAVQTGLAFHAQVSASKGAIEGLCRALAAELSPGIRVNAIAPSLTDTPLAASLLNTDQKREANAQRHPLKTIGTAANIADMAEFLLSEKAAWITGQVMHVDGGLGCLR